jgi:hypothetical protein
VAGFVLALVVAIGLIGLLIYVMASNDRYATMSEEEFEEEAKKKSLLGAAITGLEIHAPKKGSNVHDGSEEQNRTGRNAVTRRTAGRRVDWRWTTKRTRLSPLYESAAAESVSC